MRLIYNDFGGRSRSHYSHLNSSSLSSLAASVLTEVGPTAAFAEKKNGSSYVYWYTLLIEEFFRVESLVFFVTVKELKKLYTSDSTAKSRFNTTV